MTGAAQVVAMGVSGTGKSAVGTRVAALLSMEYVEGDTHHPQANIDKMSAGHPHTDEDRRPGLEELSAILARRRADGEPTILGCSALKRSYRDLLRGDGDVVFLHLAAGFDVLHERMEHREHFFPPSLLRSQLDTLEPLQPDERGVVIDVDAPLDAVVERAVAGLRPLL